MEVNTRKEVFARSLRTTSSICFIVLIFNSNSYFKGQPSGLQFWQVIPIPILMSLGISLLLALGAQVYLVRARRINKANEF
jgi:hypothetical protein